MPHPTKHTLGVRLRSKKKKDNTMKSSYTNRISNTHRPNKAPAPQRVTVFANKKTNRKVVR